ncbi:hypothetical protein PROFUN_05020 [Planoprotostelium fungivorum]|uniref:RhoGEF domain-containing protein n=1 Tax=Planoprotostelium fungivorum TaxID=1890364 RepID=A0A2P6NS56_9EUKA|nr:hypothetical protein PROFUN_05020 [Planoprotostelium fungivorum]
MATGANESALGRVTTVTSGNVQLWNTKPKVDLMQSVRMSTEIASELEGWESSKTSYMRRVQPLLDKKTKELNQLFFDYVNSLRNILVDEGFSEEVQKKMLHEENNKFKKVRTQLFGQINNASVEVLSSEIDSRKNLLNIENKIIHIQAIFRGNQVRKKYKALLKTSRVRTQIAKETLETEQTYYNSIKMLVDLYVKPLEDASRTTGKEILNMKQINAVFSNIKLIEGVNKELLTELTERLSKWTPMKCVGDIFLRFAPYLKLYTQYINNYNLSSSTITQLPEQNPKLKEFMSQALNHAELKKLGQNALFNLLITPVQRVPRYELLLRELVKNTPDDHPDFKDVCSALFKMQDINKQINDSKRNSENLEKIVKVQQKLGAPNLVQPHRRLIKEGGMFKQKESIGGLMSDLIRSKLGYESDNTQLYLFNDCLVIARLASLGDFKFRSMYTLDRITVKSMEKSGKSNTFVLEIGSTHSDEESNIPLTLNKIEDAREWVKTINTTIQAYKDRKNTIKLDVPPAQQKRASLTFTSPPMSTPTTVSNYPTSTSSSYAPYAQPSSSVYTISTSSSNSTDSNFTVEPSTSTNFDSKFIKVMEDFEAIFKLQAELYQIPQFLELQPPHQLSALEAKYQNLKNNLVQQKNVNVELDKMLRQEKMLTSLYLLVKEGQKWIDNLNGFIATHYQYGSAEGDFAPHGTS